MMNRIRTAALRRGITRLCHFTPSRNLAHIAADRGGICSTQHLRDDQQAVFNVTGPGRLDGFVDYVCCSIEYPNAWYFEKARQKEPLFPDWVVLLLRPDYLWAPGTMFCPRNAAAGYGANVRSGYEQFEALFAPSVVGARGRAWVRGPRHLPCCPTDEQAEVLVPDRIDLGALIAIAVHDEAQAKWEVARLRQIGVAGESFQFVLAPSFYEPRVLSDAIRNGVRPPETAWNAEPR